MIVLTLAYSILRVGVKKKRFFFGTLSQTMGRWGSKVPNFLVKKNVFFRTLPQNRGGGGWVGVQSPKLFSENNRSVIFTKNPIIYDFVLK